MWTETKALVAAIASGATAGVALLQAASPTHTAVDVGTAGATGAAASLAVLYAWKSATDARLAKLEDTKADKETLHEVRETLREVRDDIRYLVRERRGE